MNRDAIEPPALPWEHAPALGRRAFLRLLLGSAGLTLPLAACGGNGDYTEEDAQRLREQKQRELQASGTGPYGTLRFRGYRGLAELPYFELERKGKLRTTVADLPPVLDIHAHLGVSVLLAPRIDLQRATERVRHLLDCDAADPGCLLDLDVYINANFTPEQLVDLRREVRGQIIFGSEVAATHTIPNLLDEMDATGVAQAAVLPIALGLPFRDDLTEQWMGAIQTAGVDGRLLPCASVHPRDGGWREKLRLYAGAGARAVKLHPAMQRFFPDDPEAMEVYAECGRLGLPVVFHAGRAGIEPEFMHKYTLIRRYVAGIDAYPNVQFVLGHAGARDVADAIPVARRHPNAWLGIHGQGVTRLQELIESVGSQKLLFGSDWPFYHLAATLAKVLLVTEGQPGRRHEILRGNAERMFAAAGLPLPSV